MNGRKVLVSDLMLRDYVYYLTEPMGKHFALDISPDLSPKQMLQMGAFGGRYMADCREEFPTDWFPHAKLCHKRHDPDLSFFGVNASQPLAVWRAKGWIYHEGPRGWFQWYCRHCMGRRCPDDGCQIKRWKAMRRHIAQLKKHCRKGDTGCRPRQRKALLNWAYDSRKMESGRYDMLPPSNRDKQGSLMITGHIASPRPERPPRVARDASMKWKAIFVAKAEMISTAGQTAGGAAGNEICLQPGALLSVKGGCK